MSNWIPGYQTVASAVSVASQSVTHMLVGTPEHPDPSEPQNSLLDPISSVFSMAVLSYETKGTTVAFRGRHIELQAPGWKQSFERTVNGDGHGDLALLGPPIRAACKFLDTRQDMRIRFFVDRAIKGIETLRSYYLEKFEHTQDSSYRSICEVLYNYMKALQNLQIHGPQGDQTDLALAQTEWSENDLQSFFHFLRQTEEGKESPEKIQILLTILKAMLRLKESGASLEGALPVLLDAIRDERQEETGVYASVVESQQIPNNHLTQNTYAAPLDTDSQMQQLSMLYSRFLGDQASYQQ